MARRYFRRSPLIHGVLLIIFLLPLLLADPKRPLAQGPYPSNTPFPTATTALNCNGTDQGQACSQTSQCVGCLSMTPPAGSYTCQGYQPGVKCGTCYCTSAVVTPGNCGPWGNCNYDVNNGWCETRFCDYNGCICSASEPGCCTYQIRCPCAVPTSGGGGGGGPTNTPGGPTDTPEPPTSTPTPTPTPVAGACGQLWYCRTTDWNCTQTAGSYDLSTHLTCPASAPTCEQYLAASIPNTTGTCFNQQATCQSLCAAPTVTPVPTVTPGGPTLTNTPTPAPLFCDIIGNKYIADVAGPVGLCDDPSDSCAPATNQNIRFDDVNPLPATLVVRPCATYGSTVSSFLLPNLTGLREYVPDEENCPCMTFDEERRRRDLSGF